MGLGPRSSRAGATGRPSRPRERSSWGRVSTLLASALLCQACSSGSNPTEDGLGDIATADGGEGPSGSSAGCTGHAEGCACSTEGAMTACPGIKIHVGSRTICPPGVRICSGGVWGACLSTDVSNASSETQDYQSSCAAGTQVRWGALTLQGQIPGDALVAIGIQSSDSPSGLDSQGYQLVAAFDASLPWTPIDTGAILAAAGQSPGPLLRVTVLLVPASGGAIPTVSLQQAWDCVSP